MATTRIMPLHIGKGRTESQAVSDIIDYVANPQKTDNGKLITGYGCDSRTADAEFLLAKRQYIAATGRVRGADDVIAYHVRQSFKPGEITPEEANRLGVEFAMRFTKGNHAFVVCTHIDKSHIHNHIIWSAVNMDCDRKFRNFWGSTRAVRRLSDTICIENGLSIFTSFELSDDNGVLLGINRYNNSLCIVDLFNTKINKNANLNLLGTSGAGKTFTMQLLALRMRMRGIQCYILAPIKGHEFRRACNKIGGEFIKIAPGSPHCINVMEIRHTMSPEMELIDEIDYVEMGSMLARKIQQLMTFFGLLIPDMSNEEEQMLDEALIRTYADFGITHDNDSIYTDMSSVPPKMKQMPILGDLHKHLQENPMTQRLAAIISRFVTGSAQSFNRQTNVDLSNKYIVLDLSELKGKLLPVGMFIALDYVWDQIKSDRTKRKAIFIDEIWQLIGASSNRMAAEFCLEIFKVIRGFGGAAISATQDLSDFFGLEDGKYGRAIINNSKNKIILNLEPDEARYVQETLKLTRTEIRAITRFERGEALISSNNNKVPVVVKASKLEKEMITTDRAELEAILKERQREKTHSA